VGNYFIGLGTLGYLYTALSSVLETLVEAGKMANDLKLRDYTVVIGPEESYITTTPLSEVIPPLPPPKEVPPLPKEDVALNTFKCPDLTPGMVKFCVDYCRNCLLLVAMIFLSLGARDPLDLAKGVRREV
jgi:hypothetical protein